MRLRYLPLTILMTSLALAGSAQAADTATQARELINSQGCKGCHRIDGQGGSLAPELKDMSKKWTAATLRQRLLTSSTAKDGVVMPAFDHLSGDDLDLLVAFLLKQ